MDNDRQVQERIDALQQELARLRAEMNPRPRQQWWFFRRLFLGVLVAGLALTATTTAQLVTFTGGQPALASEINANFTQLQANFTQLQTWLEQKVGTAGTALGRIASTDDVNSAGNSGSVVIGSITGVNMGLDGNEIQARSGNSASTLFLQTEGGDLVIGTGTVTVNGTLCTSTGCFSSSMWPPGNYCILRRGGTCPAGFTDGYRRWDDEDTVNINFASGTLPDGTYDANTAMQFCCK